VNDVHFVGTNPAPKSSRERWIKLAALGELNHGDSGIGQPTFVKVGRLIRHQGYSDVSNLAQTNSEFHSLALCSATSEPIEYVNEVQGLIVP
jgi:hypothetical protein